VGKSETTKEGQHSKENGTKKTRSTTTTKGRKRRSIQRGIPHTTPGAWEDDATGDGGDAVKCSVGQQAVRPQSWMAALLVQGPAAETAPPVDVR
jgi:hypothetical protein